MSGDSQTDEELVDEFVGLAVWHAKRWAGGLHVNQDYAYLAFDDLVSEALIGLFRARDKLAKLEGEERINVASKAMSNEVSAACRRYTWAKKYDARGQWQFDAEQPDLVPFLDYEDPIGWAGLYEADFTSGSDLWIDLKRSLTKRAWFVLVARSLGYSYVEIGAWLGVHQSVARVILMNELRKFDFEAYLFSD